MHRLRGRRQRESGLGVISVTESSPDRDSLSVPESPDVPGVPPVFDPVDDAGAEFLSPPAGGAVGLASLAAGEVVDGDVSGTEGVVGVFDGDASGTEGVGDVAGGVFDTGASVTDPVSVSLSVASSPQALSRPAEATRETKTA